MKIRLATLLFFSLLSCERHLSSPQESAAALEIRSGSSFGECLGYCIREIRITEATVIYTASGWRSVQFPEKRTVSRLSSSPWRQLTQLLDPEALQSLPERIGCPDCADGGAEWIERIGNDGGRKVTFEYNTQIKGLKEALTMLRNLRQEYDKKLFPPETPSK
jgi:hypothetical protein